MSLFRSYLIGRSQYVKFNGSVSNSFSPCSGIPQGSILGPLFFVIFINDILDNLQCQALLFADVLKLFTTILNIRDCVILRKDVDNLTIWCSVNRLDLKVNKCICISYTMKKILFYSNIIYISARRLSQQIYLG